MRHVGVLALISLVAAPAFAGFAVDLPIVAGLQGISTRFYTSIDITNNSTQATDVAFEYIATDYSVDVAGTLVAGLPGLGNFHSDDIIIYLSNHGFLTSNQAKNSKGTMLLTFTNPSFTTGSEASATVRTYNYLTTGQTPSVGYSYRGFLLRREGPHSLTTVLGDTTATGGAVPAYITNLGVEDVGINDSGQVDTNPVTVELAFTDPRTGAQLGPQHPINLQSGQVTQITDIWNTYGLPHDATTFLVKVTESTGTAQIRGYVILKDVSTNDGSIYFMQ